MRRILLIVSVLAILIAVPAASAGTRAVVLVSGVAATTPFTTPTQACTTGYSAGNTWGYLRDYLVQRGYQVYTAPASVGGQTVAASATDDYAGPYGDCPKQLPARMTSNAIGLVDQSGANVQRFVRYLHDRYGVTSVDIVGHSLGGLIGRAAIREIRFNHVPVRVRSYTTLGSPWDGAMLADPLVVGKPLSACDGLKVCEGFMEALLPVPGTQMLVTMMQAKNEPVWNSYQAGVLDGIPVTLVGGEYFTKPGGMKSKWPNDGAIQYRSALATETPDSVIPHRACFSFPLTHSISVSHAIGTADDTALTWNPGVGAVIANAIDTAGTALKQPNRVGCLPKPKG